MAKKDLKTILNKKVKYYSLDAILKYNAVYNMIIGERSNGKTFSVLEYIIKDYVKNGKQGAIVRRWEMDIRGRRASTVFDGIVAAGVIARETSGKWDRVYYNAGRWYLAKYDEKLQQTIHEERPLAFAFALSQTEHDKSTSYPDINTILFDEFLTRQIYLQDEFVLFMNTVSTIVRHRDDVKIFMCANTVNKSAPYFSEMGLKHIKNQKQGTIEIYTYGDSGLSVAVEYCSNVNKEGKPSDKYFAFDNPKLQMITGGAWEMALYPHLTRDMRYKPQDILHTFFIIWEDDIIQGEIIDLDGDRFIYFHRKTTDIKHDEEDHIYCVEVMPGYNYNQYIQVTRNKTEKWIWKLIVENKVFYQDNETGEIIRNYINWCKSSRM